MEKRLDWHCIRLDDYLELVDWGGRIGRADKSGAIAPCSPAIPDGLGIDPDAFLDHASPIPQPHSALHASDPFFTAIGTPASLKETAVRWGRKFFKGLNKAQRLFPDTRAA